ncbi:glycosyltransferase family 4 protein [Mariniflexile sp. HNIBRBA6329]|uniref:glycosyltransferase family 4 protein n=1 Tax=Mariniflexile sp. HNIBRBA6329 TaxID=3373088 RepID=UPI003745E07E
MKFTIITHVPHHFEHKHYYAYSPYVREMNIWLKYVDVVEVVAPVVSGAVSKIDMAYEHKHLDLTPIPAIQFTSVTKTINALLKLPIICARIFKACKKADHIHLRCPGNIGLIGCVVQIFFPKKPKTAKYAGNWDPKAKQPLSYKFQKWLLSHPFLTKNMQVLVYGDWEHQTKNIKPFFTATYSHSEIEQPIKRDYSDSLKFVFIGSLVAGKRPLLAIQMIEALHHQGRRVRLDMYGDGVLKEDLQHYITINKLENIVKLHGNQLKALIKETLKAAHFTILPSKSEGWPKALAESMFFGVIPIATKISCVPYMLDYGHRGILMADDLNQGVIQITHALKDVGALELMSERASNWSQNYTLDVFEAEISKLLQA